MKEGDDRPDSERSPVRRVIVVQDPPPDNFAPTVQGRRLAELPESDVRPRPPFSHATKVEAPSLHRPAVRRSYLILGAGGVVILFMILAGLLLGLRKQDTGKHPVVASTPAPEQSVTANPPTGAPVQSDEMRHIEEGAKQVMRRISRDSKPYSFSERALEDIAARVRDHSRSQYLSGSLGKLQENTESIGARAGKEGLQRSLVMLLALALTQGGQNGDPVAAAARAMPSLGLLNRMFGSSEADSSLILIAAFREGIGSNRSHPLLNRMRRVVSNPLTERNVWFLHEQDVVANDAYDLVVDTIAYGVIAGNPGQFGLDHDPFGF